MIEVRISGAALIVVGTLAAVLLLSCGSQTCQKTMQTLPSPDGKYVAEVSLDGFCGGAAIPFTTYVEVRSNRFLFFGDQVACYRGAAAVRMKWLSKRRLLLAARLKMQQTVRARSKGWRDIEFAFDEQRVTDDDPLFSTQEYEKTLGF